jgi:penicillin-binding protein 2
VVFLQGGRPTFGPKAAEIAGRIYRQLYDHEFFAEKPASQHAAVENLGVSQ